MVTLAARAPGRRANISHQTEITTVMLGSIRSARFEWQLNAIWLKPKTLAEVMASGRFHPLHEVGLRETAAAPVPEEDPVVKQLEADEARMRTAYIAAM